MARCDDIEGAVRACGNLPGRVAPMTRGSLAWRITIPPDGALPEGGAAPVLIQWDSKPHPASTLADQGCTLQGLDVFHAEPDRIRALLDAVSFAGPVQVHRLQAGTGVGLSARIATPRGLRALPLAGAL